MARLVQLELVLEAVDLGDEAIEAREDPAVFGGQAVTQVERWRSDPGGSRVAGRGSRPWLAGSLFLACPERCRRVET